MISQRSRRIRRFTTISVVFLCYLCVLGESPGGETQLGTTSNPPVIKSGVYLSGLTIADKKIYVTTSSNATDTRGSLSQYDQARPFATLGAAKTAAASGDTIVVQPGSYTGTDLLKNGVNWHFEPGTTVTNSSTTTSIFDDFVGHILSVSSITRSGSTATVTTSTAHGYETGTSVRIYGAAQSEYNGNVTITSTGSTTFTYTVTGTPATPATGSISVQQFITCKITGAGDFVSTSRPVLNLATDEHTENNGSNVSLQARDLTASGETLYLHGLTMSINARTIQSTGSGSVRGPVVYRRGAMTVRADRIDAAGNCLAGVYMDLVDDWMGETIANTTIAPRSIGTFTADAGTNVITLSTHGLSDGDRVAVSSSATLPGGLSSSIVYYVISSTTNTFKVSASLAGAEIDITSAGTGTHTAYGDATFTAASSHGLRANDVVMFLNSGGALPSGLAAENPYYVISSGLTSTQFKVASVAGESGLAVTSAGTGTHRVLQFHNSKWLQPYVKAAAIRNTGVGTGRRGVFFKSILSSGGSSAWVDADSITADSVATETHASNDAASTLFIHAGRVTGTVKNNGGVTTLIGAAVSHRDASANQLVQSAGTLNAVGAQYDTTKTSGTIVNISGFVSAPASASSTGVAGQWAYDADYIYICTATNTWRRVAIATW